MYAEDRARKTVWMTGRRELEHEFGKVMRYKSIRDLASGEPGAVVAALRPVWLMSPSSVSDTLPLDAPFDVVIFDEASQIPVEEAVPALYRGAAGDRRRRPDAAAADALLPGRRAERRTTPVADDDDAQVGVVARRPTASSRSARVRLPSTMLTWHYRSRSEALISSATRRSTRAGWPRSRTGTLTHVRAQPLDGRRPDPPPEDVGAAVDGAARAAASASMRVLDGVYAQRTNPREARLHRARSSASCWRGRPA